MKNRKVQVFSLALLIPLFIAASLIFTVKAGANDDPAGKLFQLSLIHISEPTRPY